MGRQEVTIYYNTPIELNGEGIVDVMVDGESIGFDSFLELLIDNISQSLPEFWDDEIHIYVGNATAWSYALMFDAQPEIELDKYYDWLDKNYDIEFIDLEDEKQEKEGSIKKEAEVGGFRGKNRGLGLGPGGECVCPGCGYKIEHKRGEPCYIEECPECGYQMTRQASIKKEAIDEEEQILLDAIKNKEIVDITYTYSPEEDVQPWDKIRAKPIKIDYSDIDLPIVEVFDISNNQEFEIPLIDVVIVEKVENQEKEAVVKQAIIQDAIDAIKIELSDFIKDSGTEIEDIDNTFVKNFFENFLYNYVKDNTINMAEYRQMLTDDYINQFTEYIKTTSEETQEAPQNVESLNKLNEMLTSFMDVIDGYYKADPQGTINYVSKLLSGLSPAVAKKIALLKKKAGILTYNELSDEEREEVLSVDVISPIELEDNIILLEGGIIELTEEWPDFLVGNYKGIEVYIPDTEYDKLEIYDKIEPKKPLESQGRKIVIGGVVALVGDKLVALEDIEGFNIYKKGQELKVLQSTDDAIQVDDGIHKSWVHKSKFDKLQKIAQQRKTK